MLRVLIGVLIGVVLSVSATARHSPFKTDGLVRLLEAQLAQSNVVRGVPALIPYCQCTIEYVGTEVSGNHYRVLIDKLD
jgi:hypothetical protein